MMKKEWITPNATVTVENIDEIMPKTLTIESSLYASGCHMGMHTAD